MTKNGTAVTGDAQTDKMYISNAGDEPSLASGDEYDRE